ncbi:hypothetical protein AVEN_245896-1 [Araneus ventricosus]|nr:hypothetical protein AVEN_245896-1 [Araneus ventricosus]
MISRAKTMFCVSVLLGLSWLFGFFAAMEGTKLVFQYLFVITTTLQGFLFFIFFVFRQKKTRELWWNLVKTASACTPFQSNGLKQYPGGIAQNKPSNAEPKSNKENES